MTLNAPLIAGYFNHKPDLSKIQYFTLGASPLIVGTVGLDSSDQDVLCFDTLSGIVAYRNGLVVVDENNEVAQHSISEIRVVSVLPALPVESGLRLKLATEQIRRLKTGYRPHYSSLEKPLPLMRPRLVGAIEREIGDYYDTHLFLNSLYARPGLLFMLDGRLKAQFYPGPRAYDQLYRLMAARLIRGVGIAKSARVLEIIRPYARAIRAQVGYRPFAILLQRDHLERAHPGSHSDQTFRMLRHGSSSKAYGGVGAVRFALSISGNELCLVEFNLYDLEYFKPLIVSGRSLEQWAQEIFGPRKKQIYSWDISRFICDRDWEQLFLPTLQEIVYAAYTDTELGLYPRALANVHNRVKLRWADLEATRRQLIVELGWCGVTPEMIPVTVDDPHKTDPEIVNLNWE
ncbi:MAG: hypothetical protein KJ077_25705 [Anaerolineae bacterium]|nr:hypothetical protein [Anaerolineae bacterium]